MLSTFPSACLSESISSVLGSKIKGDMIPISTVGIGPGGSLEGFVSKPSPGAGRSSADKQYLFLNGRPCDLSKVRDELVETAKLTLLP